MSCRFLLVTNNPAFNDRGLPLDFRDGAAGREVITAGRDLIHLGWTLLNHPLYGNFRPNQQPYRSLLLKLDGRNSEFDSYGLSLIEQAEQIYLSVKGLSPAQTPERMRRDCSMLDFELMKETLLKYGLIV